MVGQSTRIENDTHWHGLRAKAIGGSEVAALFGLSPYMTRFELWHTKAGNIPAVDLGDDERMRAGNFLEPAIAAWVREKTGWRVQKVHRYLTRPEFPGLGGSLDYEVIAHERGSGVLEIKNVDWLVYRDQWQEGEPPLHIALQGQSYLAVTGRDWGAFAVLVGGNDLKLIPFERRPITIAKITTAVAEFWRSIVAKEEPRPDFTVDGDTLAKLYASIADSKTVDLSHDNRLAELCATYQEVSEVVGAMEKSKKAIRAELFEKVAGALKPEGDEIIGKGSRVICGAYRISAWTVAEAEVAYTRKAFADFRVSKEKSP